MTRRGAIVGLRAGDRAGELRVCGAARCNALESPPAGLRENFAISGARPKWAARACARRAGRRRPLAAGSGDEAGREDAEGSGDETGREGPRAAMFAERKNALTALRLAASTAETRRELRELRMTQEEMQNLLEGRSWMLQRDDFDHPGSAALFDEVNAFFVLCMKSTDEVIDKGETMWHVCAHTHTRPRASEHFAPSVSPRSFQSLHPQDATRGASDELQHEKVQGRDDPVRVPV